MIKVSCIMPTTIARIQFIPFAIDYFLRQADVTAELIIVNDDPGNKIPLIPESDRIRYIEHPTKFRTIGSKRNFACSLTKGDIILHWDDDDWYAPDWISKQVYALESNNADITGLDEVLFFSPEKEKAWQYVYNGFSQPWVAGATLAYKKSHWESHPFKDMHIGEDNEFVWHSGGLVAAHSYINGFVSIIHPNNTSSKHTLDPQWQPRPVATIQQALGKDMIRY